LVALSFNLLFRLGIRRTVSMTVDSKAVAHQEIVNFIERAAGTWGARRDVMTRVEFAVQQAVEAIVEFCKVSGPITVKISYDEFDIDAELSYDGVAVELADRPPSQDELLGTESGPRMLSGFLIRRQADRAHSIVERGATALKLHFKH
jgi:NCS2 family nucleobase:cation symporter-2